MNSNFQYIHFMEFLVCISLMRASHFKYFFLSESSTIFPRVLLSSAFHSKLMVTEYLQFSCCVSHSRISFSFADSFPQYNIRVNGCLMSRNTESVRDRYPFATNRHLYFHTLYILLYRSVLSFLTFPTSCFFFNILLVIKMLVLYLTMSILSMYVCLNLHFPSYFVSIVLVHNTFLEVNW